VRWLGPPQKIDRPTRLETDSADNLRYRA